MKYLFKCLIAVALVLVSFVIINWGLGQILTFISEWSLIWFIVSCLLLLFLIRVSTKILSVVTAIPISLVNSPRQLKILKWLLLGVGWSVAAFNFAMTFHAIDFSETKTFAVGFIVIFANWFIPWDVHSRIQVMEDGVISGEKAGADTVEIAYELSRMVNSDEIPYTAAIMQIQSLRDANKIDNFQANLIVGILNKKTGNETTR